MSTRTPFQRSMWGEAALAAFKQVTNSHEPHTLADVLCDLMHWADAKQLDFDCWLAKARDTHDAERTK